MNTAVMFSSKTSEWETPQHLFDQLHAEFGFDLDVCATPANAKCPVYLTKEQDGLKQPWRELARVAWMNPPYGRKIGHWVRKAYEESAAGCTVACLLPARTDTRWFHSYIWDAMTHKPRTGVEVRLLPGRLKFGGAKAGAPFPSMIVVFHGRR